MPSYWRNLTECDGISPTKMPVFDIYVAEGQSEKRITTDTIVKQIDAYYRTFQRYRAAFFKL